MRRSISEDVQDQLAAVDDLALRLLLERPDLRRRQVVVEDDQRRLGQLDEVGELDDLSAADVGLPARLDPLLDELADHLGAGGLRQRPKLPEGIVGVDVVSGQPHADQDGPLGNHLELFSLDLGQLPP
jgi:hypothetical protein